MPVINFIGIFWFIKYIPTETDLIGMEDHKLYDLVMRTKAKLLLGNARMQTETQITSEMEENIDPDILNDRVRHDMSQRLSREVINNYAGQIQKEQGDFSGTKYTLDLMVIPTESFKYTIDEIIKLMPQEHIDKLRNDKL